MLRTSKNTSIYKDFGRNRPIETIDGYDGTVHRGTVSVKSPPLDLDGRSRWGLMRCVIKGMSFHPLDRDLMVWMLPARLNHDRYNPFIKARALMNSGWPQVHPINAQWSALHPIQCSSFDHVTCILEIPWDLVPHGLNYKRMMGL